MPETTVINLKGRIREVGPSLELAPHVVYIGRSQTQGYWKLRRSHWANPYTAKQVGGAQRAVDRYRRWLFEPEQAELRARIVPELHGKTLACWCAPGPCHGDLLAKLANARPALLEAPDDYVSPEFRRYETVALASAWAGAL
jgi:hypothetical protein